MSWVCLAVGHSGSLGAPRHTDGRKRHPLPAGFSSVRRASRFFLLVRERDRTEATVRHTAEVAVIRLRVEADEVVLAGPSMNLPSMPQGKSISLLPVVIITRNGERDFPPAYLRHCVRLRARRESKCCFQRFDSLVWYAHIWRGP